MNKKVILVIVSMMLMGLFLISCSDDETSTTPTPTPQNTVITTQISQQVTAVTTTEGGEAVSETFTIIETVSFYGDLQKKMSKVFDNLLKSDNSETLKSFAQSLGYTSLSVTKQDEEPFDFVANCAVYTYNGTDWDVVPGGDVIKVVIPSSVVDGLEENIEYLLSSYAEEAFTNGDGFIEYLPTNIDFSLTVGGVEEVSITYNALYNSEGMPTELALALMLNPYAISIAFTDNGDNIDFELVYGLANAEDPIIAIMVGLGFEDMTQEVLEAISAYIVLDDDGEQLVIDFFGNSTFFDAEENIASQTDLDTVINEVNVTRSNFYMDIYDEVSDVTIDPIGIAKAIQIDDGIEGITSDDLDYFVEFVDGTQMTMDEFMDVITDESK